MKDFRDLKVWEKAHALVLECYEATKPFPREEISDSSLRFGEQQRQFLQTLRKAAAVGEMRNFTGFCRWLWALRMNLNTTCYCPKTWDI